MAIPSGSRIGSYEVTGSLGAGGMGEVYRARDTRLNRDVALKVLPDTFAADADRLARFQREAQLLATLNHPHIGAIYGLVDGGSADAFPGPDPPHEDGVGRVPRSGPAGPALVLELVEGPTLADRILQGPIPFEEAVPIARQIAEALEAAHDKGIIHRDLKPANIKLTPNGNVKVLDFGLAKLNDPHASHGPNGPNDPNLLTMSPTILSPGRMTSVGLILGTAAYMAPEQAKGREVDRRADIWAFGCVLYEMLTGRQPFAGDSIGEIVSEVLKSDPEWQRLPVETPAHVRRLLARCLQKDPARRLHHIADARLDLDETPDPAVSGAAATSRWRMLPWAVTAAVSLAAVAVSGWAWSRPNSGEPGVVRLELNVTEGLEIFAASTLALAVSPDSTQFAYVAIKGGARQVYIRRLDQFEATPVRGSDGATTCFFSSDGRGIGIVDATGLLKVIDLGSGTATSVIGDVSFTSGVAWGDGGRLVFARSAALWHVTIPGGTPAPLTTVGGEADREHIAPLLLPGGNVVLFTALSADGGRRIDALEIPTGQRRTVVEDATLPRYVGTGHLVYFREGELFAVPFDAGRLETSGPAAKVLELPQFPGSIPDIDISLSGTLVYAPGVAESRLVWSEPGGAEQPISDDRRTFLNPRLSPDGSRIVVQATDIWIHDLRRSAFTRVAPTDIAAFPIWTPDGQRVVFKTSSGLRVRNADGSGEGHTMAGTTAFDYPASVTADGRTLVMLRSTQRTSFDIHTIPFPDGGELTPVVTTPAYEGGARLSRDGRWLTYVSNDSGRNEVYVRPFPGPDRRMAVSNEGGTQPMWSPDGRTIYYRSGDRMMAVDVVARADTLDLSSPRIVFDRPYAYGAGITQANYDMSPDGRRFLMVKDESLSGRINVVLNWASELRRATAGQR